ncbi:hypothetical protein AB0269_11900 [Microbacterium sp. NPDC077644]|uniref:hypothetical protein n=1 Tax=Microbacterium sp. NPDC077644 TaxID=3155055 RepID=UPI00344D73BB
MLRRATGDPVSGYLLMGVIAGVVLGILPLSRYRLRRTDIERAEAGPPPGAPA